MRVIAVHGAGGGGWQWRIWSARLATEGWAVQAPDLRPASGGVCQTGFADYLEQVQGWRDARPEADHVLVGASLGGLLALAAAARRPPRALVLVNPVPPQSVKPWPALRQRPARVPWSELDFARTRRALPDATLAAARWAHARWRDESGLALNQAAAGIAVESPRCPVLVLAAADDTDIPPATSWALASSLGAAYLCVPKSGHLGILLGDAAPLAAAHVAHWLNGRIRAGNTD